MSAKVESSPKLLGVDELCAGQWWQQFTEIARKASPQFAEELRNLIADYLPVAPVLGQTSIGPRRADEIDNYLATHQKWILRHPKFAVHALAQTFLEPAAPDARRDVMAALAFLAVARRRAALLIISNWDEISSASYTDRGPALEAVRSPSILLDIAIISDAPSPAQFSLLERVAKELRQCHIHKIFTHRISDQNMPWNVGIPADYDPVFFPREHLRFATAVEKRSVALFRRIRRYILENQIRVIILQGSNNLTRLLLVKWARRSGIPLLIAGDYNVFCQPNLGALPATARAIYYRWLLRNVSGLMPTGTCGRAFFRQLYNHSLPEFPFPPEPDYSQFTPAPSRQRDVFLAEHSLDPARKRFLFFGRLDSNSRADLLLDAFASFALRNADWDLLVAGDGELRRALESRSSQNPRRSGSISRLRSSRSKTRLLSILRCAGRSRRQHAVAGRNCPGRRLPPRGHRHLGQRRRRRTRPQPGEWADRSSAQHSIPHRSARPDCRWQHRYPDESRRAGRPANMARRG